MRKLTIYEKNMYPQIESFILEVIFFLYMHINHI